MAGDAHGRPAGGDPDRDRDAASAVADALGGTGWAVAPLGGSGRRTFLATGPQTVVVRFEASPQVLSRVSDLGIGPRVLAAGRLRGRAFVVQEHVAGGPVSGAWIATHVDEVARLVAAYMVDPVLAVLAEPLPGRAYAADLLERARAAGVTSGRLRGVERLVDLAAPDAPGSVATHGDPNSENFIAADRLLLVDWDDLRLADPMRDLAQLAWWYLPESEWHRFLAGAGHQSGVSTTERLFWWMAAESLDVALRLIPTDARAADAFFVDFDAAIARRPNPRGPPGRRGDGA